MTRETFAKCVPACAVLATSFVTTLALGQQFQDQTAARFPNGPHEYTNQMSIGDLDNDGDLDIVFGNGGGFSIAGAPEQLRIYVNNGSGVFTDESIARLPANSLFLARGVELGDVNGDGFLDIIVAQDFSRQPQLFINTAANPGHFTNETAARLPVMNLSSARAQFADVDNDGDLDLYLVHGGASRFGTDRGRLWINTGDGHFVDQTDARMPAGTVVQPMDCIFGDLDGNFSLDLIIASRAGTASTANAKRYMNNGAGVFTNTTMPSTKLTYSFDLGDMDGDGDLDLLGVNSHPTTTNAEVLARNGGTGTLTSLTTFPPAGLDDNDSKFFDYDNDGDLDVIVCAIASAGADRIYTNTGNATYSLVSPGSSIITQTIDSSLDVEIADFDGDGRLDIVTAQGESAAPYVNRIYMNVTGPVDTIAPRVARTEQIQDSLSASGPWNVRTVIYDSYSSDRGFRPKGVHLNYTVNNGKAQQVPLKWVGNSMWRGAIPPQPTGSVVQYWVTAVDHANNIGVGDTLSFNVLWPPCPADTNVDHVVNVADLLTVISGWGAITPVTHHISVADFSFTPDFVNAKSGDTVQFNWVSGFHTATSGTNCTPDGRFNQSITSTSPVFAYPIPTNFDGLIPFFCSPHCSIMSGEISVAKIPADVNGDGFVNVADLLAVISGWGPCPQ